MHHNATEATEEKKTEMNINSFVGKPQYYK